MSFNVYYLTRVQLESLTPMVYKMSIQKEENNGEFKPQIYQKRGKGQNRQNFGNRDRNRSFSRDKRSKTLDPTIGDNHKTDAYNVDMTVGEEVIDVKIIIIEMTVEIEGDKTLGEASIMTIGIETEHEKEV